MAWGKVSRQKKSRFCGRKITLRQLFYVIVEEVMVQDEAYLQQQARVYALALEDGINIGALATQFSCEPRHRAFLAAQLGLNDLSYMHHL